ncbi:MAG TPA: RNA polymerase sigma-70 factor [Bacteroidales bacterium]|nr:RNA polymerase sigma-70 factor [Bacteroidales bacterium]
MNTIEANWIKEIQLGNIKAFDSLFKSYYSPLCLYASDIVKDRTKAEEIVQDVFLKFWNNRDSIYITTSVKAYLYRMIHNQALNYIRNRGVEGKKEELFLDDIENRNKILDIESSYNVLDELINEHIEKELTRAIADLSPQCREIFCLARYQNLSYREIATKLDISLSTVKSQMLRSIEKLKSLLKEN